MQFAVYLNSETIEDAVLEESFAAQVKALVFLKRFPFFKLFALASSFEAAQAAMQRERQVMGGLTMLLGVVESKEVSGLRGRLFEVDPATGESVDAQEAPSRMRLALFADANSNHVSAYSFNSAPDRHFCLLYNDFATRPEGQSLPGICQPLALAGRSICRSDTA